ncbi:MAG: PRC and DUF2382 domain-containing protein [Actinomycetota bacterium]|nr:PRC and DUF2382 domain-containing protein [Actinomycetota bacterium]
MIQRDQILAAQGSKVLSAEKEKVGTIEEIYLDRDTDQPEWVLVDTGSFGTRATFVPLAEANMNEDELVVPYAIEQIKGAPNMEPTGELSENQEAELYSYYGLEYSQSESGTGLPEGQSSGQAPAGQDASGSDSDDAMTRSEEELRVGTTQQERGRARLKKYVVTENVQQTVPVQKEEVRVEREPITEANVDEATDGPAISDEEHEVVLREEQPVVEKQVVPKERVKLSKDTVTEDAQVSEEIRREQIEPEGEISR